LTIVGDGPDLPRLRDEFSRGSHIPVRLLPARAPWEMDDLLQQHDVFLQVSEFEGASVSLMEAMIAGQVPVVTLTRSGTELLQHDVNCALCPVGDLDAIAGAIIELQADRERAAHLSRGAFLTARAALQELDYPRRLRGYLEQLRPAAAA
jgi:glycosyltransferase involved in cell wall biosynthesis